MTSDPVERYLTRSRRLQRRTVLRPMAGGELMDETLALYRSAGASLLLPVALSALIMAAAEGFVAQYVIGRFFETQQPGSVEGQMLEFIANSALGLFVAAPIWIIALSYATALSVRHVGWILLGQATTPNEAVRDARRVFPSILLATGSVMLRSIAGFLISGGLMLVGAWLSTRTIETSAAAGIVAAIGIVGLFIGFFWFMFVVGQFGLVAPVAIIEGIRGRALMRRTVQLVKASGRQPGAAGTIVSLVVASAILDMIISGGLDTLVEALSVPSHLREGVGGVVGEALAGTLTVLPSVLSHTLVLPFFTIAITVLYFERRVRIEGYDITALASDIDTGRRPVGGG
ncbi:hypothetical protein EON81_02160 [bacterium]|nr:MAG: hypothetical protein EON81_02160 [bacterium]